MSTSTISLRAGIVLASALIYWGGVIVNVYRVRKHIGRSPNIKPRGLKERLLWVGWFAVIAGWIVQPFLVEKYDVTLLFSFVPFFYHYYGFIIGTSLVVFGYACTLWCYAALGDSWRIGINKKESTALVERGPYSRIRHPIYLFQIILLIGAAALLPTLFSFMILLIHFFCVLIKSLDEEAYLLGAHNAEYADYFSHTGRFLPKLW